MPAPPFALTSDVPINWEPLDRAPDLTSRSYRVAPLSLCYISYHSCLPMGDHRCDIGDRPIANNTHISTCHPPMVRPTAIWQWDLSRWIGSRRIQRPGFNIMNNDRSTPKFHRISCFKDISPVLKERVVCAGFLCGAHTRSALRPTWFILAHCSFLPTWISPKVRDLASACLQSSPFR